MGKYSDDSSIETSFSGKNGITNSGFIIENGFLINSCYT